MIPLTAEDVKRIERAMAKFNTCDLAGSYLFIEVDKKTNTKSFKGFCTYNQGAGIPNKIDVEPTCRICLRHEKIKKRSTKKTAAHIQRIKKGRLRQKQRQAEREDHRIKRPGLEYFR